MSRKAVPSLIIASLFFSVAQAQTSKSRVGKLDFEDEYPSKKTVERLYDAMDFQRAAQAYLWAVPSVGFARVRSGGRPRER